MAINFFDYSSIITDPDDNIDFLSFALTPPIPITGLKNYTIPIDEEFRPDKISVTLYDVPDLAWLLNEINNFYHPFKDYTKNRIIKYISLESLPSIGINLT